MIRKLFKWVFKNELLELQTQIDRTKQATLKYEVQDKRINNLLQNIDVSVDVHQYSPSWAVVSLQGQKSDYIKFIELGDSDLREIASFLRRYDREVNIKIDATPNASGLLRFPKKIHY